MNQSYKTDISGAATLERAGTYFHNLDALRFIAFLFVFKGHAFVPALEKNLPSLPANPILNSIYNFFVLQGGLGVSFFFVLSGFLITYFLLREKEATGNINLKNFYIKRILRIWPLYFAVLLFAFFMYPFLSAKMGWAFPYCSTPLYYFTFLSNFDVIQVFDKCGRHTPFTMVTWSIAVQEQFYLVLPVLLRYSGKKVLLLVLFLLFGASVAFRLYHVSDETVAYYHTLGASGDLTLGCLVAYFSHHKAGFLKFFSSLRTPARLLLYTTGFGFALIIASAGSPVLHLLLLKPVILLLFAFVILTNASFSAPPQTRQLKYFTGWGRYTYGMYLLHSIVITALQEVAHKAGYNLFDLQVSFLLGTAALLLTVFVSYVSFVYFESRFLRLKRHFTSPLRPVP